MRAGKVGKYCTTVVTCEATDVRTDTAFDAMIEHRDHLLAALREVEGLISAAQKFLLLRPK